jgi:hypothetical protein
MSFFSKSPGMAALMSRGYYTRKWILSGISSSLKLFPGSIVPVLSKNSAHEGAGRDQATRLWAMRRSGPFTCTEGDRNHRGSRQTSSRQGRRFLCSLSFRRDKKKVRRGAGRSARGLDSQSEDAQPRPGGPAPPTAPYSFAGPKDRKGPATGVEHYFAISGIINDGAERLKGTSYF